MIVIGPGERNAHPVENEDGGGHPQSVGSVVEGLPELVLQEPVTPGAFDLSYKSKTPAEKSMVVIVVEIKAIRHTSYMC